MKVEYLVTFRGVIPKYQAALDKMIRDDIAGYPARQKMDGATVERVGQPKAKAAREVFIAAGSRTGKSDGKH